MDHVIPVMDAGDPAADAWRDVVRELARHSRRTRARRPAVALSLHRPWPWMIGHLGKDVENRDWGPRRLRLPARIALHAAATVAGWVAQVEQTSPLPPEAFHRGLVATVEVTEVHPASQCRAGGYCSPWASPTGYHWHLARPRWLTDPVPATGRPGLWPLTPEQRSRLAADTAPSAGTGRGWT